jgi:DNA-binding CsgD family transcriptional regulator
MKTKPPTTLSLLQKEISNTEGETTDGQDPLPHKDVESRLYPKSIRESEAELEIKNQQLLETNMALKVLLKRREMGRNELEEQVQNNVRKMILPYINTLRNDLIEERHRALLSILETNLNEITHAFAHRLAIDHFDLTPKELEVANLIRHGKRTGQIAQMLSLSPRTVESHRQAIRNKLQIQNKKINLRTFLLSLA